ncbi:unnamed protein product [Rotaria sordida]|uniref:Uncharacterized protein n=1 Tax=Rotaria sordida TaxID=392033 RepID=A0A815JLZ7_9BILA|nr:unnamed protein product [Rotaria sordida]CAF1616213.1 unnamed protein product [Rotaria sordida]
MARASLFNESIVGYVCNISNEHKKKKFYVKFTMQSENNRQIDGWIFSGVSGILITSLGVALTNSMKNHTGLRIWGKVEEDNGDESGTAYLATTDLAPNTFLTEHSYDLTHVRRKMFNGVPILSTTINTNISSSSIPVTADVSEVTTTLAIDLSDKKTIISSIEEVGTITRSNGCSTCKGDLTDVNGAAALVYCQKCQRHSLKKNIAHNISTTIAIKDGEEKIVLWVGGRILEQLLIHVGLLVTASDTEIAMALLSDISLRFEYSVLCKELITISIP